MPMHNFINAVKHFIFSIFFAKFLQILYNFFSSHVHVVESIQQVYGPLMIELLQKYQNNITVVHACAENKLYKICRNFAKNFENIKCFTAFIKLCMGIKQHSTRRIEPTF